MRTTHDKYPASITRSRLHAFRTHNLCSIECVRRGWAGYNNNNNIANDGKHPTNILTALYCYSWSLP